jgi:hypothetical protein
VEDVHALGHQIAGQQFGNGAVFASEQDGYVGGKHGVTILPTNNVYVDPHNTLNTASNAA